MDSADHSVVVAERVNGAGRLAAGSGTASAAGNRTEFHENGEPDTPPRRHTRVVYPNESDEEEEEEEEEEDDPDFLPGRIEPDLPPVVTNRRSHPIVLEGNEEEEEDPMGPRAGPSTNGPRPRPRPRPPAAPAPQPGAWRIAPGSSAARLTAERRAAQRRREGLVMDWQRELSGVGEEDAVERGQSFFVMGVQLCRY